jgi:hypothetical protein
METNVYFIQWLEDVAPDRLPLTKLSDFELGVLVGERQLVERIKIKLEVKED